MNQAAEVATIPQAQAPIKFSATKAAISKMAKKWKTVPDMSTKEGYALGQQAKRELTPMRTTIVKEIKEQKKLAQEHIAGINTKGNELVGMVEAIENPIYTAKKVQDEAVAKERRETEEKEERRILAIESAVEDIQELTGGLLNADLKTLEDRLSEANAITISDATYMEFVEQASQVLDQAKTQLINAVETAKAQAVQQKQLDAQQAEIKEAQRKNDLQASIGRINMSPVDAMGETVDNMLSVIDKLSSIDVATKYGDLAGEASTAINDAKQKIDGMIAQQRSFDEQQAVIDKQKQDQADRDAETLRLEKEKADEERLAIEQEETDKQRIADEKKNAKELSKRMPEDIKVRTWMGNILAIEPPEVDDPHLCAILRDGFLMLSDLNKMVYEGTQSPADEDGDKVA